jgi:hypothetical protein
MIDLSQIRAVRNHNPGNINSGAPWVGLMPPSEMTPAQAGEHRFCVFIDDAHGFRALAEVLKTYRLDLMKEGKFFCLEYIIERWAPPTENNTGAYVAHMVMLTGYQPLQVLPVDFIHVGGIAKGISTHEVGVWAFNDASLSQGLRLAGL